jgi:hypothetical protein
MWRKAVNSSVAVATSIWRLAGQPSRTASMPLDPAAYYVRGSFSCAAPLLAGFC